ncbi:MAG: SIKE family protein [Planctomycetaceae bacterium]|nr:SIKE family protein [Planctomycetaceae bacterium]
MAKALTVDNHDADEIVRLRKENERLRELLKVCQPYVDAGMSAPFEDEYGDWDFQDKVLGQIEKELGLSNG